eukprot:scaffold110880_cov34-Cyclotella_meneghiniana.AAC.2
MASLGPLIVDFPTSHETRAFKTVCFSRTSTMKLIPYHTQDEKFLGWYSKEDEAAFKHQRSLDVIKFSAMLMQDGDHNDYNDKLIQCAGINQFLSEDILQRYKELQQARLDHEYAVLKAQDLQRKLGICRPEDLARISIHSSRAAKERAHQVALVMRSL